MSPEAGGVCLCLVEFTYGVARFVAFIGLIKIFEFLIGFIPPMLDPEYWLLFEAERTNRGPCPVEVCPEEGRYSGFINECPKYVPPVTIE